MGPGAELAMPKAPEGSIPFLRPPSQEDVKQVRSKKQKVKKGGHCLPFAARESGVKNARYCRGYATQLVGHG